MFTFPKTTGLVSVCLGLAALVASPAPASANGFSIVCQLSRYLPNTDAYTMDIAKEVFPTNIRYDFANGVMTSGPVKGKVLRDTPQDILWNFELRSGNGYRAIFEAHYNKVDGSHRIKNLPVSETVIPFGSAQGRCARLK